MDYLLRYDPDILKRDGVNAYRLTDHDSFYISKSDGSWYWNSRQIGGRSALKYLTAVRGMHFAEAVQTLLGIAPYIPPRPKEVGIRDKEHRPNSKKSFKLPQPAGYARNVISYLQDRGIHPKVISACLNRGLLYESKTGANCVFVGFDENKEARFAAQHGTKGNFKKDVFGSDKRYGFCLPPKSKDSSQAIVFESAINVLSHVSYQMMKGFKWDGHRLALGGTSPAALINLLEQNPKIKRVTLCLDNDKAGYIGAQKIKRLLNERFDYVKLSVCHPHKGNDFNDFLQHQITADKKTTKNRQQADFLR